MKTKYYLKVNEYVGLPKLNDFKLIEEDLNDELNADEALTEAVAISVDPYVRAHDFPSGQPVSGFKASSVAWANLQSGARILKSRIDEYPEGCVILYHGDWKTIEKIHKKQIWYRVDSLLSDKELTRAVGVLGMPGLTAYIGFLDICKPSKGETVMVNACTGAVGSLVGQIAKIKGCRAVGCCGTDEKVAFAKSLGYDDAFNYKTEKSWPDALKRVAPEGIDCFFDNVGGQLTSDIMAQMNPYGRISSCGAICSYNSTEKIKADMVQGYIVGKRLEIKGFIISDELHRPQYAGAIKQMAEWIAAGKLKVHEHITQGFENLPQAFIDLLNGTHMGKAVVRI